MTENGSLAKTTSAASVDSIWKDNEEVKTEFSMAEGVEHKYKPYRYTLTQHSGALGK